MTTDADIAKVLRDAAGHVRGGWCQGEQYVKDDQGKIVACCLLGGLALATPVTPSGAHDYSLNYKRYETACDFIRGCIGAGWAIHQWNDAPGRTQDEVIDALEGAAASLEEERNEQ